MKTLSRLLLALSSLLGAGALDAETGTTSKPEKRWYQVEVVIFAQQDKFGDEQPGTGVTLAYPGKLLDITRPDSPFPVIHKDQRQLGPEAYTLNRDHKYRVLYHQAWQQPGRGPASSPWIKVLGGNKIDQHYELEGSLRVYKTRFLHVETRLWNVVRDLDTADNPDTEPGQPSEQEHSNPATIETGSLGESSSKPAPGVLITLPQIPGAGGPATPEALVRGRVHTLQESQQLKLGQLHYLDHASMGMLIRVDRIQHP